METVRIMLVDDHEVVRNGLKALFADEPNMEVVLEANSGKQALEDLETLRPDIVITDMSMPGISGIELLKEVRARYPEIGVLILSMHDDEQYIMDALNEGAMGYITKDVPSEELLTAIKKIADGRMHYSSSLTDILARQIIRKNKTEEVIHSKSITDRELEILQLIVKGLSNKQIADKLFVSKRTVDNHRSNLMKKMGANNTADIVRISFENGLVNSLKSIQ